MSTKFSNLQDSRSQRFASTMFNARGFLDLKHPMSTHDTVQYWNLIKNQPFASLSGGKLEHLLPTHSIKIQQQAQDGTKNASAKKWSREKSSDKGFYMDSKVFGLRISQRLLLAHPTSREAVQWWLAAGELQQDLQLVRRSSSLVIGLTGCLSVSFKEQPDKVLHDASKTPLSLVVAADPEYNVMGNIVECDQQDLPSNLGANTTP